MYSKINSLERILPDAEKFILDNDRLLYRPFFETTEHFCIENSVLIGGRVGIDLLAYKPLTKDSFLWDLYSGDAFDTARRLAIALANTNSVHVPADTVAMQTHIKYKELSISINARLFFRIFSMDKYRGLKLVDLMGPATRDGYFTGLPVKCVSEEMQLIEIYRNLYSPAKMNFWAADVENENKIYHLIKDVAGQKATGEILGAADDLADLSSVLRGNILIGDHAMTLMGLESTPARPQIISAESIESLCARVKPRDKSARAIFVKYSLNLPTDFQIAKYTIYLQNRDDQTPLMDVFNSSSFEMIPFRTIGEIKIGNPWVILRFLFIDLWTLKLILHMGSDQKFVKQKIYQNLARANTIRKHIAGLAMADMFQIKDYIGVYINEHVIKKKMIKELGENIPVFYPSRSGGDNIMQMIRGPTRLRSGPIELNISGSRKQDILMKITGRSGDVMHVLEDYRAIATQYLRWGVGKSVKKYFMKNAEFVKYIPHQVNTLVDIGCGSGLDIKALDSKYKIGTKICVDIEDNRSCKDSKFIHAQPNQPLDIPDNFADLVTVFHSLHHMQDGIGGHFDDFARITRPGGLVFIKDHDVRTQEHASNVDFEHAIYMSGEWEGNLTKLFADFGEILPMFYYSMGEVSDMMTRRGFIKKWAEIISPLTYIYGMVFQKKEL